MYITQNKYHHIKSDAKMALRNTNPWFLQHPFKVYFTTRWTTYFAAYSNFPANECKILATMQDFLIICSFTITFKALFQKRFSIKCHLPIAPSGVTINQPIWLKRNLSILKGGGASTYLTCTHFSFIFMFYCRFQVGACCMVVCIANSHPNTISNSLKIVACYRSLSGPQLSFQREAVNLLICMSSHPKL